MDAKQIVLGGDFMWGPGEGVETEHWRKRMRALQSPKLLPGI